MHKGVGEIYATELPRAVWGLANPKSPGQEPPPGAGAAAGGRVCKYMCINTCIIFLTPKVTRCKQFDGTRNYGKRTHQPTISVSFKLSGIFLIFSVFFPLRVRRHEPLSAFKRRMLFAAWSYVAPGYVRAFHAALETARLWAVVMCSGSVLVQRSSFSLSC